MRTQVSENDLDRNVGPDRNDIHVHQSAGAVLVVGENLSESLLILMIKRAQYFLGQGLGEIGDKVGEIIKLHALGCREQLFFRHALQ